MDPGDSLTPLYAMLGASLVAQAGAAVVGFVKWLGARTVDHEDKDKADLKARLDKHEERFEEQAENLLVMEKAVTSLQMTMQILEVEQKSGGSHPIFS